MKTKKCELNIEELVEPPRKLPPQRCWIAMYVAYSLQTKKRYPKAVHANVRAKWKQVEKSQQCVMILYFRRSSSGFVGMKVRKRRLVCMVSCPSR